MRPGARAGPAVTSPSGTHRDRGGEDVCGGGLLARVGWAGPLGGWAPTQAEPSRSQVGEAHA